MDLIHVKARLEAATPGPWVAQRPTDLNGRRAYEVGPVGGAPAALVLYDATTRDVALVASAPGDLAALVAEVEAMRGEVESQERAHAEEIARYQARIAEAHHAHAGALDKLAWLGHVHSASSRCAACAAYDARQAATQGPGPLERTVFEPKDRTPAPSGEKEAT